MENNGDNGKENGNYYIMPWHCDRRSSESFGLDSESRYTGNPSCPGNIEGFMTCRFLVGNKGI